MDHRHRLVVIWVRLCWFLQAASETQQPTKDRTLNITIYAFALLQSNLLVRLLTCNTWDADSS